MNKNQASGSALIAAFCRAYHSKNSVSKIFDDFLAYHMLKEKMHDFLGQKLAQSLKFIDPESAAFGVNESTALARVLAQNAPLPLSRSKYTETILEEAISQGVQQYVILGAGMDTFAFRRPNLLSKIRVFEVDHPNTQALKRHRISELNWKIPEQLNFVPVDFTKENLTSALKHTKYDLCKLSFFGWLGVTYYLTPDEVFSTLQSIADIAPVGSTVIFDFLDTDAFIPEKAPRRVRMMLEAAKFSGEPMKSGFDTSNLANNLSKVGFQLCELLSPQEIEELYFKGNTDGYHAFDNVHFARAVVV